MLSVVITAWNEEKNIARAISSVKSIADEIVVVDTESTDKTTQVAKKLGAKVFHHKNTGIVEPVRNYSISKARGDWIFLLDADEEIPASLASQIKRLTDSSIEYYRLPRKNIIFNKWIKSSHWWPDYVYRLFKKGSITWDPAIHSIPFTRGKGQDLPPEETNSIIHHNYDSVFQYIDRLNRYTDHQAKFLQNTGYSFGWSDVVEKPSAEFLRQYFANQGYREGLHGLALSLLQSFSELVLYLKLWQQSGFIEQSVPPKDLEFRISDLGFQYKWWTYEAIIRRSNFILRPFLKLARWLKV